MEKLFRSMNEGEEWFYARFGKDKTFDATARSLHLWDMPALLLYINGLIDGDTITTLLTEMQGNTGKEDGRAGGWRGTVPLLFPVSCCFECERCETNYLPRY